MVSVAMCTYNGARYLSQQLESIANQTHPVDELIVCDDRSTDNTIEVIQFFAQSCSFPVVVHSNVENLGSTKNFEKCLNLCSGDVIFLCDQDDSWREDKVARQLQYLNANPGKDAVFSDAMMMDDDSKPLGRTIWEEIEFNADMQRKWEEGKAHEILFNGFVVTGATLAIRKSCLARLMPFPTHVEDLIHDAWMAMVLSLENKIGFIADNLISYRRHESQQVGFGSKIEHVGIGKRFKRPREEKLIPIKEKAERLNGMYLLLRELSFVPREKLIKLYLAQNHFYRRASLPENRLLRISPIFRHVVKGYYVFSSKDWWLPAIGDLIE